MNSNGVLLKLLRIIEILSFEIHYQISESISQLSFTNILMIDVNILTQFRSFHNPIKAPNRVKSRSMLLISYNLELVREYTR